MGVVYKAEDTELQRFVALKFLPPALSYETKARERFISEARAASRLDHRNICTVYEIGRTEAGQIFIAMAFYDGETLKEKIGVGSISVEEATDYAQQIARGLEKAHTEGIVHRDVKPANIMVRRDGTIKILDFGLAKVAEHQQTQTGTTMGTISYMSPEQARGDSVDLRTDIWSLGILYYEMLTCSRPFKGLYSEAVIYNILNEEPDFDEMQMASLPVPISESIHKCLQKDRNDRFESMRAFLNELSNGSEQGLTGSIQKENRRFDTQAMMLMGLIALLAGVSIWLLSRPKFQGNNTSTISARQIALLPFEAEPENNHEVRAFADGIVSVLAQVLPQFDSPQTPVSVFPVAEFQQYGVTSAKEASKMLGANQVLSGEVKSESEVYALTYKLFGANQVGLLGSENSLMHKSSISNVAGFQEELLEKLSSLLGLPVPEKAQQTLQELLPAEPDAYAYYLQGVGYLQRYDLENYIGYSIQHFRYSLEEDSLFALSHAGLCEALWEKWRHENDRSVANEALVHCDRAAELIEDQAPAMVSIASVLHRTDQNQRAIDLLRQALELEPGNAEAYRWLGRLYESTGQPDSARVAYVAATQLKPNSWVYHNELGIMLSHSGHHEEAATQFERVGRLTPDNFLAFNALGVVYKYLDDVESAEQNFIRSSELRPDSPIPHRNLGQLYFRQNEYEKAIASFESALAVSDGEWMSLGFLGHAYYWNNEPTRADSAWQASIARAEELLEIQPGDVFALVAAADAYGMKGESENARATLTRLLDEPHDINIVCFMIGRIYEKLGDRSAAFDYLERALELGFDLYVIQRDPWLNDLREDPRYDEIIGSF